jgi:folate-binding protein YgfZ
MFVLRSRVVLAIDEDWQAAAVVGPGAAVAVQETAAAGRADDVGQGGALHWLRGGPELLYALGPRARVAGVDARFEPAEPSLVDLAEIRLGLPRLGAALTERYVPQMLNLDLLGAVAFDKGCYPGQEVVARLKYRGDVKRRVRRFAAAAAPAALPAPGDEIVDAAGAPAGEVMRAARSSGGIELLAVVQLEAAAGELRLAADRNVALEPRPLPFEAAENGL